VGFHWEVADRKGTCNIAEGQLPVLVSQWRLQVMHGFLDTWVVRAKLHAAKGTTAFIILKKSVNWVRQSELVWMLDIINLPLHHGDERLGSAMATSDILDQCSPPRLMDCF